MKIELTPKVVAGIALAALILVGLVGWFGLVSPERSKAASLNTQIADADSQLIAAKAVTKSLSLGKGKKDGLGALTTAMPLLVQMPAVLREVQKLASSSNLSFDSFTPATAEVLSGYDAIPIDVAVAGRYADVKTFLHRLRVRAGVSGAHVHAAGRLFNVETVGLTPGGDGAPQLTAAIHLAVFVYNGVPLAVTLPTITDTTSTTTTAAGGTP